jgi:hypothetical protein
VKNSHIGHLKPCIFTYKILSLLPIGFGLDALTLIIMMERLFKIIELKTIVHGIWIHKVNSKFVVAQSSEFQIV